MSGLCFRVTSLWLRTVNTDLKENETFKKRCISMGQHVPQIYQIYSQCLSKPTTCIGYILIFIFCLHCYITFISIGPWWFLTMANFLSMVMNYTIDIFGPNIMIMISSFTLGNVSFQLVILKWIRLVNINEFQWKYTLAIHLRKARFVQWMACCHHTVSQCLN